MGNLTKPIQALIDRLTAQTATGGMLDGFKFIAAPTTNVHGEKDLPNVRLTVPEYVETLRAASRTQTLTVHVVLSTKRTTNSNSLIEHFTDLEKLLDAIDCDPDNDSAPDLGLNQTLAFPLSVATGQQYALDLSINTELTLTLVARASQRGSMRV